ncbi:MAG: hypothetical protein J1F11_07070 [Oscillospiraceae bacterium]|nr:hypothetical protein [Oscillospiraceae bacterium]
MDGTGFLKTVRVGGFDKKDVLAYVDDLNSKIYALQAELDEKVALLEDAGGGASGVDTSKYEELLAADKAKITELQTSNDSLKNQMKSLEDDIAEKDKEIEALKAQNTDLENQLQEAKNQAATSSGGVGDNSAMDLSNVFIEAQKTANTIVMQAKENARKMDEDAKKLANQVVDDANGKASTIVKSADERASKILSDAEDKSSEMRAAADKIKREVTEEINEIDENVTKLKEVLEMFSSESLGRLNDAKAQLDNVQSSIQGIKISAKPAPAPAPKLSSAPAPAPTPAPQPVPQPAPQAQVAPAPQPAPQAAPPKPAKPAFAGFDMSELESLTKAVEAEGGDLDIDNINLNE